MTDRRSTGRRGEALALSYLVERGYRVVTTNWRTRFGEIDIVAQDGATLVFVEVRTRASSSGGSAAESVDGRKQRQLVRMAEQYLQRQAPNTPARIDVVTIYAPPAGQPRIEHLPGAVDAR